MKAKIKKQANREKLFEKFRKPVLPAKLKNMKDFMAEAVERFEKNKYPARILLIRSNCKKDHGFVKHPVISNMVLFYFVLESDGNIYDMMFRKAISAKEYFKKYNRYPRYLTIDECKDGNYIPYEVPK